MKDDACLWRTPSGSQRKAEATDGRATEGQSLAGPSRPSSHSGRFVMGLSMVAASVTVPAATCPHCLRVHASAGSSVQRKEVRGTARACRVAGGIARARSSVAAGCTVQLHARGRAARDGAAEREAPARGAPERTAVARSEAARSAALPTALTHGVATAGSGRSASARLGAASERPGAAR